MSSYIPYIEEGKMKVSGHADTMYINEVYRSNLSSFTTTELSGYKILLTNQTTASENGVYESDGSSFIKITTNKILFLCDKSDTYDNVELWEYQSTNLYKHQNTFAELATTRSRNSFISNVNSNDTNRNIGEVGAFIYDGAYLGPNVLVATATNIFIFVNTHEIKRVMDSTGTSQYENMQLKFTYRLKLTDVYMDVGFSLSITPSVGNVNPNLSLFKCNPVGWDTIVGDKYNNLIDYSTPFILTNPGAGFKDLIIEGEFFVDMGTNVQATAIIFTMDTPNPSYTYEVASGSYINWQIANMQSI